jgi:hypothetical protein
MERKEGNGRGVKILITNMFGSNKRRGGEVRAFNCFYVWFMREGKGF